MKPKIKTRIISLFLTVLMIVGLLPMSLFAVDGSDTTGGKEVGDDEHDGTEWTAPDLEDIVKAFYPDIENPYDSSNWEKIFAEEDFSSLVWNGYSYTGTNGPEGNAYLQQGNVKSEVKVITEEGDDKGALYFGVSPEGTGNGDYVEAITIPGFASASNGDVTTGNIKTVPEKFGTKYGGRDILVSFDYKPEKIGAGISNFLEIITRFQYKDGETIKEKSPAGTYVLGLKNDGGTYYLTLASNKMTICKLPTDNYTNIKVLIDVGGPSAGTCSNMVYVFINNELKASGAFITDSALLTAMYNSVNTKSEVCPYGFYFCGARINRNAYKTNSQYVKNVETYYFGNTDTSRLTNIYAYLDFNDLTEGPLNAATYYMSKSSTNVGISDADRKITSLGSALAINASYFNCGKNTLVVSDGNGGKALQMSCNSDPAEESYVNIGNGGGSNPYNSEKVNANRDFVFSIDIKLGENVEERNLINIDTRNDAGSPIGFNAVGLNSDGSLKIVGNGADNGTVIGYLNSNEFTNIAVKMDVSENLFYVYVNGVLVNKNGSQAFKTEEAKIFFDKGLFFVRLSQVNSSATKNREIYDNAVIYFLNDTVTGFIGENTDPLNGFVKKKDGYLYYYENGSIAANYDNGFVKTDSDGVVLLKKRTTFIDWKNTLRDKPYDQIANLADWNGKGDGYNEYYNHISSTVGGASALHLWSNMTNLGGGDTTFAIIPDDSPKDVWYNVWTKVDGKDEYVSSPSETKQEHFLDITGYTDIEFDIYSDGYQEFVAMLFLGNPADMYGVDKGKQSYYSSFVNFGTKDYDRGYGHPDSSNPGWGSINIFNNTKFKVNGWTTVSISLANIGGSRLDMLKDPDGNKLNPKEYISQFKFYSVGWGQLDRKYADGNMTDYVLNGTDCRFLIKDIYLVNYEKVTSLSDIAEYVGGDLVPLNGEACFSGLYTATSGNRYYYSAYDHSRVTDKDAYDIMGNETVTGYSFDENGVATPLDGVYKVQTERTHLYVDGVMQKGSATDEFKVTVDGVDYRINAEGDYLGAYYFTKFMAGYPSDYKYASGGKDPNGAATNHISATDFGSALATMPVSASKTYTAAVSVNGIAVDNRGKLNVSAIVDDFFEDKNNNNVLKLDFVNSERDGYAQVAVGNNATASDGKNVVFEYDLKLGDDWNGNLNIQFNSRGGSTNSYSEYSYNEKNEEVVKNALQIVFKINERGELTNSAGDKVFYQFSANEFSKIAFVAKYEHVETKDVTIDPNHPQIKGAEFYDLKIDAYVNGVKVAEDLVAYRERSYKYMTEIRFAALGVDSSEDKDRSGSLYFDNFALYYGNGIVPQYVSTETLKGVVGGKYYDNGTLLTGKTLQVGDVFYSADADGWLKFNTGVSVGSNGLYYNFVGFAGRICDGIVEEKYYIDGVLKSGIFTDDGKQMFADPNNENKLVKDGTITYDEKTYDIANYIATVRSGIIEDKYWVDGVYQTGIIKVEGGIYYADAQGVLQYKDEEGVEIEGAYYDFEGYLGKARNGIYIFEKGTENECAYFYQDGVISKGGRIDAGLGDNQYYFADAEGKLIKQTGNVEMSDGNTYNFDEYVATLLHEIAFDGKYWRDGKVVKGEDIQIGDGTIYSADAEGNLRANGVFQANDDGLYYYFDANYVGTLCDDFDIFDDVWYVDGKPAEGIQYVDETERYFENGKPTSGRVQMPDGTVHEFGEDGFRSSDDKKPHSIKLTLKYNGTEVTKEFYSYDGFGFTYTPINIDCMGYTITDKDGNVIDKIDVAAVTEDLKYVITYNSDAKSHTPVMAEDTESTCTVAGQTTYVCAVCGEALPQLTVIKPLLAHSYVEISRTESTCTVAGSISYECEWCKAPKTEALPLAPHTWDSGVRTAPTCTVAGKTVYTCTADGCGATRTVVLPATGIHVWELTETVESTCAEMGHETYTCSVCKTTKQYDLPLLAHTYDPDGEYEILQEATETASGVLGYDCIVCEKKNAIAIEYAISYEGLQAAVSNGGTVMLMADITMTTETLRVSKDTVLELNGYDIVSENSDAITVTAGTLVINGDGEVKGGHYGDNSSLNAIYVSGTLFRKPKVIINGGTYNTEDCAAIYIGVNGNVEINGGYFKAEHTYNGYYWTLNLQDDSVGAIVVKGGQFENFDPSDTNTEPAGKSDNFVAKGYEVVVTEDATGNKIYTVVPEEYTLSTEFRDNLEAGGKVEVNKSFIWNDQIELISKKSELLLGEDSVLTVEGDGIIDLSGNAELVIDGKGKLNQTFDSELGYLVRAAGNSKVTIKDGHFIAGLTAVQAGENAVVEIYGGYFEALATWDDRTWILNLIDNSKAKIIVYGGTFVNYDPSNSATENPEMNFVAEGYKVVMTEDATGNKIYTVVPEE